MLADEILNTKQLCITATTALHCYITGDRQATSHTNITQQNKPICNLHSILNLWLKQTLLYKSQYFQDSSIFLANFQRLFTTHFAISSANFILYYISTETAQL